MVRSPPFDAPRRPARRRAALRAVPSGGRVTATGADGAAASASREVAVDPLVGPSAGPLVGCPGCGALQHGAPEGEAGGVRYACVVCGTTLERPSGRGLEPALACSLATFLLLFPANFLPFLTTSVLGVSRTSRLASSAAVMLGDGWPLLAGFVFLFVVALPFVRFGLLTLVLSLLRLNRRPPWLGECFRIANTLQTWAMPDVFLLALAVAYARLGASIATQVDLGAKCFIVAAILSLFARATLDKAEVWRAIGPDFRLPAGEAPDQAPDQALDRIPGGGLVSCTHCERLAPAADVGRPCPRCNAKLHARKPGALGAAAAFALAGLVFYLPANLLPLATLPIGFTPTKYTVLQGVIDLVQANLLGLAALVFVASFAIPFLKLVGMGWCLQSTLARSDRRLKAKTRLYAVVEEIGRWSMVDPFVIGCFTPVMHYNAFIYGRAEAAATPFALVVVLTILSSHRFDPRLMWDAAAEGRRRRARRAAASVSPSATLEGATA